MARLYADEDFPLGAVLILRGLGHDVLTVPQAGRCGADDSELLADVYLELIGGRQSALSLSAITVSARALIAPSGIVRARPTPLASRLTEVEIAAHAALIAELGDKAMWNELLS